jgi:maltokinase
VVVPVLNWTRRMIQVRDEHPAFGLGSFTELGSSNPSVLAYLRQCPAGQCRVPSEPGGSSKADDLVICVNNLSRFPQPVELDLSEHAGGVLDAGQRSRPVGAEQSNTSLVYGQSYILKLFGKLVAGRSPDLELHRALAEVGCAHIAAPLGSIEGELGGDPVTYGMLTHFFPNTADGWAMATASVRDLLAEGLSGTGAPPHPAEAGGDFASEAHRLGHAVATVHADLVRTFGCSEAEKGHLDRLADAMQRRLHAVRAEVPELAEHVDAVRSVFDGLREISHPVLLQRLHGDLHLGQVLRTVTGWVLIDFEGEPATPLAERRAPASPLRDVAGMLRSFDYAADHIPFGDTDPQLHAAVALEWAQRNRDAFCDGYAEVTDDPREQPVLLRAFELDKAVYEVAYEHGNRPTWLPIPLASVARITAGAQAGDR